MVPSAPLAAIMLAFQYRTMLGENCTSVTAPLCSVKTTNRRKLFHENKRKRPSHPPETKIFLSDLNFTTLHPSFVMGISHLSVIFNDLSIVNICRVFEALPQIPLHVTGSNVTEVMYSRNFKCPQLLAVL